MRKFGQLQGWFLGAISMYGTRQARLPAAVREMSPRSSPDISARFPAAVREMSPLSSHGEDRESGRSSLSLSTWFQVRHFQEVVHLACVCQGHLTTECFQIRQNVSQIVFSVLQRPVGLIWSCSKNYLSVLMSQENFGRFESFRWLFRLIRNCQLS